MPDTEKLFEKAEKYLQKQKFDSALEVFREIYKFDPNDDEVILNIADLSLKLNRTEDALRYYVLLADFYIRRNDAVKGIAACKKVLKLSPQDAVTETKLASLLEKTQKKAEALEAYRAALALHRQAGSASAVLDCLQHIVGLEPTNLDANLGLAEAAAKAGQAKVAAAAYLPAAKLAREAGDEERWADFVERAYTLDGTNEAACIASAELLIKKQRPAEAAFLLDPIAQGKPDDLDLAHLLARAHLDAGNLDQAEPLCWKVFRARPEALDLMQKLVEGHLRAGASEKAMTLTGDLKGALVQQGKKIEFLKLVERIYQADDSNLAVLEILTDLYNEMNKEDPLRRSLSRLFNLYLAAEQYDKAADTLERILDVDPYGAGHHDRLLNLEGHIDPMWYKNIAQRVEPLASTHPSGGMAAGTEGVASSKQASLQDLIVEAEMFYQYQLPSKLKETLEKINALFPGAEERNPRLQQLYDTAGFAPKHAPPVAEPPPPPPPAHAVADSAQTLEDLSKISTVTANIYRESTAQGVMQVTVNEVGRTLGASRCWGGLGSADRPPALTAEYCDPSTQPGDIQSLIRVYTILMKQAGTKPDGWLIEDAGFSPALASVMGEIEKLEIVSLLAFPLLEKDEVSGMLLVEQCDRGRKWTARDTILLKAIAPQVVVAIHNTKLRRLVRSLAGTDPETGLLPRASYTDCLLAEARRAKEQSQPVSVCLIEPENAAGLVKTLGDAAMQKYFQQVSKTITSCLRQNDIAIRYSPSIIAVLLPDTALPQGGLAVEKLRRMVSNIKPDRSNPPGFCAAVADLYVGQGFDAVDGTTEVINRLQAALEQARKEGSQRLVISKFEG